MRQATYLNAILTINAALLTGILWTQVADQPLLSQPAAAQDSGVDGIPNAAAQRQKMIEALRDIKVTVDSAKKLLEGGKLKVEVTNIDHLKDKPK